MNTVNRKYVLVSKLILRLQAKSLFEKSQDNLCFEAKHKKAHAELVVDDERLRYFYAPKWL